MIRSMLDGLWPSSRPAGIRLRRRTMPSMARWTPPPFRRRRKILQVFMRVKACSTRTRNLAVEGLVLLFPDRESGPTVLTEVRDERTGAPVTAVRCHGRPARRVIPASRSRCGRPSPAGRRPRRWECPRTEAGGERRLRWRPGGRRGTGGSSAARRCRGRRWGRGAARDRHGVLVEALAGPEREGQPRRYGTRPGHRACGRVTGPAAPPGPGGPGPGACSRGAPGTSRTARRSAPPPAG